MSAVIEIDEESDVLTLEEETPTRNVPRVRPSEAKGKPKQAPSYHVVIWNDEEHTYEYVIEMLMELFGHSAEAAYKITHEVDHVGKGVAKTCHLELAELKRDLVLGYGADWRMSNSRGSIRCTIELAPE